MSRRIALIFMTFVAVAATAIGAFFIGLMSVTSGVVAAVDQHLKHLENNDLDLAYDEVSSAARRFTSRTEFEQSVRKIGVVGVPITARWSVRRVSTTNGVATGVVMGTLITKQTRCYAEYHLRQSEDKIWRIIAFKLKLHD